MFEISLVHQLKNRGASPAIEVDQYAKTYAELAEDVRRAALLLRRKAQPEARIGILAQRSYLSIVAILATVEAGMTYVPLNPKFPVDRLKKVSSLAGCAIIVADQEHAAMAADVNALNNSLLLIGINELLLPETNKIESEPWQANLDLPTYIIFTSGTTGEPKGVPITRRNLKCYLDAIKQVVPLHQSDRCSHYFDLSFDPSVHDIFYTLSSGACLCIPTENEIIDSVGFAARKKLTVWFSVPSVIAFAHRMRRMQENNLPSLRLGLFCGEALPATIAEIWGKSAPNSRIFNLYGPTEATITILFHELEAGQTENIAPIGKVFPGSSMTIRNEQSSALKKGEAGELLLGGGQVALGYLNSPSQTEARFVRLPDTAEKLWYRTGDLTREDESGVVHFLGRIDEQVKINGNRIELLEVEAVLRRASGIQDVAVVLVKDKRSQLDSLVGFVCGSELDYDKIIKECGRVLPTFACPRKIIPIQKIPLNVNGKVDRKALAVLGD